MKKEKNGQFEEFLLKAGSVSFGLKRKSLFSFPGGFYSPIGLNLGSVFKDSVARAKVIDFITIAVKDILDKCNDKEKVKIVGVKYHEQDENKDGVRTEEWAKGVAENLSMDFCCTYGDLKYGDPWFEGVEVNKNDQIIVIDDIVVTGSLTNTVVQRMESFHHAKIISVVAIMDYGFPEIVCRLRLDKIPFESVTNCNKIVMAAYKGGYINKETAQILRRWEKDPIRWWQFFPEDLSEC